MSNQTQVVACYSRKLRQRMNLLSANVLEAEKIAFVACRMVSTFLMARCDEVQH